MTTSRDDTLRATGLLADALTREVLRARAVAAVRPHACGWRNGPGGGGIMNVTDRRSRHPKPTAIKELLARIACAWVEACHLVAEVRVPCAAAPWFGRAMEPARSRGWSTSKKFCRASKPRKGIDRGRTPARLNSNSR